MNDDIFGAWAMIIFLLFGLLFGILLGRDSRTSAIAADLAAQGYVLQRVETVGEEARWMVVEQ